MNWLLENWDGIVAVMALVWLAARELAERTPTKVDDKLVAQIEDLWEVVVNNAEVVDVCEDCEEEECTCDQP